jgi:uncharacterized protein (TIGR00730 family)
MGRDPRDRDWGKSSRDASEQRFLAGPRSRLTELWRAFRIFGECIKGFRALHFVPPCVTVFGSARFAEDNPYYVLARRVSQEIAKKGFTIMTGGGPGIMEAANRGATEAGGKTIGLNISLPFEQAPNPYISPELSLEFGYFFLRKFWFAYLAKALVVFPGGFGTMDELFEILTLVQTRKLHKEIIVVLYGESFWKEIFNFEALAKYGMISPQDLNIFQMADTVDGAFEILREGLTRLYLTPEAMAEPDVAPAIAKTRNE